MVTVTPGSAAPVASMNLAADRSGLSRLRERRGRTRHERRNQHAAGQNPQHTCASLLQFMDFTPLFVTATKHRVRHTDLQTVTRTRRLVTNNKTGTTTTGRMIA